MHSTKQAVLDLLIILIAAIVVFFLAGYFDLFERMVEFSHTYERYEADEFLILSIYFVISLAVFSFRRYREILKLNSILSKINEELSDALSEIKQLKGILPICSACKKIRDDKGFWHRVETYIRDHSDLEFSHSICPSCAKKLYPEFYNDEE